MFWVKTLISDRKLEFRCILRVFGRVPGVSMGSSGKQGVCLMGPFWGPRRCGVLRRTRRPFFVLSGTDAFSRSRTPAGGLRVGVEPLNGVGQGRKGRWEVVADGPARAENRPSSPPLDGRRVVFNGCAEDSASLGVRYSGLCCWRATWLKPPKPQPVR